MPTPPFQSKDPLHGLTLETILTRLVEQYGWAKMLKVVNIRCFFNNPVPPQVMPGEPFVPPGGPPQSGPSREIYARMGRGNIFRLCADFYAELETTSLRKMFPADMQEASKKTAAFFVGLLGGPPLYAEQFGPPRMRARHLPFAIDDAARQVWLSSFKKVLEGAETKYGFPAEHLPGFVCFLEEFSGWMVNRR
jgi:hemoglobin